MSSHGKHHKYSKQYEYKVITSRDLKDKNGAAVDEYLNALGSDGWELVSIDLKEKEGAAISFLGLMKRKSYHSHKDHGKH